MITPSFYIVKRHNANVGLMLKGNGEYVILSLFQFNPTREILPWIRIINGNTTDLRWADKDLNRIHRMLPRDVDIRTAKKILLEIGPHKALKSILNAPENFKINYQ